VWQIAKAAGHTKKQQEATVVAAGV